MHNMEHGGMVVWYNTTDQSIIDDMEKIHTSSREEAVEMRNALIDIADLLEESLDAPTASGATTAPNLPIPAQLVSLLLERFMGNALHGPASAIQVGPEEGTIYAEENTQNDTQNDQQQPSETQ